MIFQYIPYYLAHYGGIVFRPFGNTAAQYLPRAYKHHRHCGITLTSCFGIRFRRNFIWVVFGVTVDIEHHIKAFCRLKQSLGISRKGTVFSHAYNIKAFGIHISAFSQRSAVARYGKKHSSVAVGAVFFKKFLSAFCRVKPALPYAVPCAQRGKRPKAAPLKPNRFIVVVAFALSVYRGYKPAVFLIYKVTFFPERNTVVQKSRVKAIFVFGKYFIFHCRFPPWF